MERSALLLGLLAAFSCTAPNESSRDSTPLATAAGKGVEGVPADASGASAQGTNGQSSIASGKWTYPESRRENVEETLHGEKVADPYRWLEAEKSPEVRAWMTAQDQLARSYLSRIPGRDELAVRFKELLYVESASPPVKRGNRFFYTRRRADQEKAVVYWKAGESGKEKVLLDPNTWSDTGEVSLGSWSPSWDGKRVAFQQRPQANDEAVLHVIDVDSGRWSKIDVIEGGKYAHASWTPEGRAFYYTWIPVDPAISPSERPGHQEVRLHRLGSDPATDQVIRPKLGDPTTFQSARISRDGKYLFHFISRSPSENELYLKQVGKDRDFKLLAKGKNARYSVTDWKGALYITTDDGAPFRHVLKVSAAKPSRENWKEIVPQVDGATLENAEVVGGHLTLEYLKNAASELRVATLDGKPVRTIALPEIGTSTNVIGLPDQDDGYFMFSSFTAAPQIFKTSIKTGSVSLWKKVSVPIDPTQFMTEQAWYQSKDGTRVSMFIVRRKDLVKDGSHPVLLNGYGGFNLPTTPAFRSTLYPWLEAGGVFALANLRGGSEYGHEWHESGRLHRKQNVFDDFIAAGEYLINQKYTQPSKLAIFGGSNGGLLVGAAMTQRPDLFGAVICSAPLLDMVRYHLFGSGKTWIPEYGNPDNSEDLKVLHAYSPYHHVRVGVLYPPLLMMSPAHDDRVDPMHARKFIAALQKTSDSPSLMRIETNSGHQGGDLVRKLVESNADEYAFLFNVFGMKPGRAAGPSARAP